MYPSSRRATFSLDSSGMSFWIGPTASSSKGMVIVESSFLLESTIFRVTARAESSLGERVTDRLKSTGNWCETRQATSISVLSRKTLVLWLPKPSKSMTTPSSFLLRLFLPL